MLLGTASDVTNINNTVLGYRAVRISVNKKKKSSKGWQISRIKKRRSWERHNKPSKSEHHPNLRTATVGPPHTSNIPGFQVPLQNAYNQLYTLMERCWCFYVQKFFFLLFSSLLVSGNCLLGAASGCRAVLLNMKTAQNLVQQSSRLLNFRTAKL